MKVIKEVIVVEGKHDSATLKQYFKCDTVITNGLSLDEETLAYIKELNETRGVILFLDPDDRYDSHLLEEIEKSLKVNRAQVIVLDTASMKLYLDVRMLLWIK